jgi:hypothetical protein
MYTPLHSPRFVAGVQVTVLPVSPICQVIEYRISETGRSHSRTPTDNAEGFKKGGDLQDHVS